MTRTRVPLRVGVACLTLATAAAPGARAFDFWPHVRHDKRSCFDKHCDTTRVVIPQRQVEVVNERPQVIIRETAPRETVTRTVRTHHAPAVTATPIGTVYMPLALPTVGAFPLVGAAPPPCRDTVESAPNPLEAFHRAELAQLQAQVQAEKAQVELRAAVALQQRVAARLNTPVVQAGGGTDTSGIERRLTELATQMRELNDRVNAVEKLLLTHHNVIKDRVLKDAAGAAPSGGGTPDPMKLTAPPATDGPKTTTGPLPMIPPLPER